MQQNLFLLLAQRNEIWAAATAIGLGHCLLGLLEEIQAELRERRARERLWGVEYLWW
ncbi:MAG: hypothetical protein ACYDBQ_02165 [Thermoplasmatota archaeon]